MYPIGNDVGSTYRNFLGIVQHTVGRTGLYGVLSAGIETAAATTHFRGPRLRIRIERCLYFLLFN
jgi:hypothetical protein